MSARTLRSEQSVAVRAGGRDYVARFTFSHWDPARNVPGKYRSLIVSDITECELLRKQYPIEVRAPAPTGRALCTAKDRYRRMKGVRLALDRAVHALFLSGMAGAMRAHEADRAVLQEFRRVVLPEMARKGEAQAQLRGRLARQRQVVGEKLRQIGAVMREIERAL